MWVKVYDEIWNTRKHSEVVLGLENFCVNKVTCVILSYVSSLAGGVNVNNLINTVGRAE